MTSKSKASRDSAKELAQKLFSAEEKKGINNHLIARYISHSSQEYADFKLPQTQTNGSSNNSKKIAYLIVAHYLKIHNMNDSLNSFEKEYLAFIDRNNSVQTDLEFAHSQLHLNESNNFISQLKVFRENNQIQTRDIQIDSTSGSPESSQRKAAPKQKKNRKSKAENPSLNSADDNSFDSKPKKSDKNDEEFNTEDSFSNLEKSNIHENHNTEEKQEIALYDSDDEVKDDEIKDDEKRQRYTVTISSPKSPSEQNSPKKKKKPLKKIQRKGGQKRSKSPTQPESPIFDLPNQTNSLILSQLDESIIVGNNSHINSPKSLVILDPIELTFDEDEEEGSKSPTPKKGKKKMPRKKGRKNVKRQKSPTTAVKSREITVNDEEYDYYSEDPNEQCYRKVHMKRKNKGTGFDQDFSSESSYYQLILKKQRRRRSKKKHVNDNNDEDPQIMEEMHDGVIGKLCPDLFDIDQKPSGQTSPEKKDIEEVNQFATEDDKYYKVIDDEEVRLFVDNNNDDQENEIIEKDNTEDAKLYKLLSNQKDGQSDDDVIGEFQYVAVSKDSTPTKPQNETQPIEKEILLSENDDDKSESSKGSESERNLESESDKKTPETNNNDSTFDISNTELSPPDNRFIKKDSDPNASDSLIDNLNSTVSASMIVPSDKESDEKKNRDSDSNSKHSDSESQSNHSDSESHKKSSGSDSESHSKRSDSESESHSKRSDSDSDSHKKSSGCESEKKKKDDSAKSSSDSESHS